MAKEYDFHLHFKPRQDEVFDFDSGCVIKEFKDKKEYHSFRKENPYLTGVKIKAQNKKEFDKKIKEFQDADYIALESMDYELVRYAIKRTSVDVILHNEERGGIDAVIAKECASKKISIDICFKDLLESRNMSRTLKTMALEVELCKKYKTPLIISSGAKNYWELVPKNNLTSFGEFLGLSRDESRKSLSFVQEKILERKNKGYLGVKGIEII